MNDAVYTSCMLVVLNNKHPNNQHVVLSASRASRALESSPTAWGREVNRLNLDDILYCQPINLNTHIG